MSTTFTPDPWWQCLFRRWSEPEFLRIVSFRTRVRGLTDWSNTRGSLYRQTHRRTGCRQYYVVCNDGTLGVDGAAYEHNQSLIFT